MTGGRAEVARATQFNIPIYYIAMDKQDLLDIQYNTLPSLMTGGRAEVARVTQFNRRNAVRYPPRYRSIAVIILGLQASLQYKIVILIIL